MVEAQSAIPSLRFGVGKKEKTGGDKEKKTETKSEQALDDMVKARMAYGREHGKQTRGVTVQMLEKAGGVALWRSKWKDRLTKDEKDRETKLKDGSDGRSKSLSFSPQVNFSPPPPLPKEGTTCSRDPRKRKLKLPPSHPDYQKPGKTASPPQQSTTRSANLPKHTPLGSGSFNVPLGEKSAETRNQPSGTGSAAAGQVGVDSKSCWNYKSRACTFYTASGKCRHGETCNYYHDESERRFPFTYGEPYVPQAEAPMPPPPPPPLGVPPPPPPLLPPPPPGSLKVDTTARPQTPPLEQPNILSNPHNTNVQLPKSPKSPQSPELDIQKTEKGKLLHRRVLTAG